MKNDKVEMMKADLVAIVATLEAAIRYEQDRTLNELMKTIERNDTAGVSCEARWIARLEDDARKTKRYSAQLLQLINRHVY